tara:strand:- start:215 stop:364 length:150 start_codon:yes stop_codon:yes gene_type:complete
MKKVLFVLAIFTTLATAGSALANEKKPSVVEKGKDTTVVKYVWKPKVRI